MLEDSLDHGGEHFNDHHGPGPFSAVLAKEFTEIWWWMVVFQQRSDGHNDVFMLLGSQVCVLDDGTGDAGGKENKAKQNNVKKMEHLYL